MKKISLIFTVFLLIIFISFQFYSKRAVKLSKQIDYVEIALPDIENGIYQGEYELPPVKVSVETAIQDGKISSIDIIEHQNGLGGEAEKIIDTMIKEQKINVDAISGATVSSTCIKKAVEDSLLPQNNIAS